VMTGALRYLGTMSGKLRYLEYSDLQFRHIPSQNVEVQVPTTRTTRDESYPDHRSADRAGNSRKYGDAVVRAGQAVRMLGILCTALTT